MSRALILEAQLLCVLNMRIACDKRSSIRELLAEQIRNNPGLTLITLRFHLTGWQTFPADRYAGFGLRAAWLSQVSNNSRLGGFPITRYHF